MNTTVNVRLYDGRYLPVDPETAERLDRLIMLAKKDQVSEVNKLLMTISAARRGHLDLTTDRWRDQFNASLGSLLRACDVTLGVGTEKLSLYDKLWVGAGK